MKPGPVILAVLLCAPTAVSAQRTGGSFGGRAWSPPATSPAPSGAGASRSSRSSGIRYTGPLGVTRSPNGRRAAAGDDDGPMYVATPEGGEGDLNVALRDAAGSPACGLGCAAVLGLILWLLVYMKNHHPPRWL